MLKLKEDIFYRAKLFIDDMGEFAPFGSELVNNEIKPIVIYDDTDEVIDGVKLISHLKDSFSIKFANREIEACAIAYDVFINIENNNIQQKRNALCLEISVDGKDWEVDYYIYEIIKGECVWG